MSHLNYDASSNLNPYIETTIPVERTANSMPQFSPWTSLGQSVTAKQPIFPSFFYSKGRLIHEKVPVGTKGKVVIEPTFYANRATIEFEGFQGRFDVEPSHVEIHDMFMKCCDLEIAVHDSSHNGKHCRASCHRCGRSIKADNIRDLANDWTRKLDWIVMPNGELVERTTTTKENT